jgi:hypothetical protein
MKESGRSSYDAADESGMDGDYDISRPAEPEAAAPKSLSDDPDIDAQLQGQQIQNERGRDKLSDYGRSLLG